MPPKVVELQQDSKEWLHWRACGLGSSDAPVVVGLSPWKSTGSLLREKRGVLHEGRMPVDKQTYPMLRGKMLEPRIRRRYEELMGFDCPAVCAQHPQVDWLKASLDGYHAGRNLVIEIKAPGIEDHLAALDGKVPQKYVVQLQHQFLVTDARVIHYCSYSENKSLNVSEQFRIVPVYRDRQMEQVLWEAEREFWERVTQDN